MKILALLPEAATVATCLDTAEAAAACLEQPFIEALHVMVDPAHIVAAPEEIDLQYLRFAQEGSAKERARAAQAVFNDWIAQHPHAPVSPRWTERDGTETEAIHAEAGAFDLLVVPRSHNLDGRDALFATFYHTRHPFVVAPRATAPRADRHLADCIVVAWNGTPACRRAAEAARPFLGHSTRAIVLLVAEGGGMADDFAATLRNDNIAVEIRAVPRDSESLGDQIVTEAQALGATLLVMGAHRHNAWIEWFMGHTTDQALRHDDITFLMAH